MAAGTELQFFRNLPHTPQFADIKLKIVNSPDLLMSSRNLFTLEKRRILKSFVLLIN